MKTCLRESWLGARTLLSAVCLCLLIALEPASAAQNIPTQTSASKSTSAPTLAPPPAGGALSPKAPALAQGQNQDQLNWNTNANRVSANIKSGQLLPLLEQVAEATGWSVFVEPETSHGVSARFKDLPPGEALRLLLGDLNFALLPGTNNSRLFVFQTSRNNATQQVRPRSASQGHGPRLIANELVVRLKPGANIDEIAKALGAKVVGKIGNLYRLRFDDVESTQTARTSLASNSDVESVENNYAIDRPEGGRPAPGTTTGPPSIKIEPPPDSGRVIVGLIDTAVQPLGSDLDALVLKPVSVAGDAQLDPSSPSHGTSMLATLFASLAATTGGSTSVQVLPVDVYGPNSVTSTFDVADGIARAINDYGAKVINMSLGSEGNSQYLADLIAEASKKNIVFIGAAGNQPVTTPYYPAALPDVLAVTALDQGHIASYANRGDFVSLGAPGTSIVYYQGRAYYAVGTSAAAAYASGVAAGHMDTSGDTAAKTEQFLKTQLGVKVGGQ